MSTMYSGDEFEPDRQTKIRIGCYAAGRTTREVYIVEHVHECGGVTHYTVVGLPSAALWPDDNVFASYLQAREFALSVLTYLRR